VAINRVPINRSQTINSRADSTGNKIPALMAAIANRVNPISKNTFEMSRPITSNPMLGGWGRRAHRDRPSMSR
jgi:hypothetical protein